MDGDRLGPLSYDLTPAGGDSDPVKAVVVATIVTAAILAVGLVGGWLALGFVASSTWLFDGLPVVIVVVPLLVAYRTSRYALRGSRMKAMAFVGLVVVFAAVLTNHALGSIKPALPQVRHSLDSMHLPPGYTLLTEETSGDRFCRHGCPRIDRRYAAPVADPDPVRTFILKMFDQGWAPTSDVDPKDATTAAKHGLTAQLASVDHVLRITVVRDS